MVLNFVFINVKLSFLIFRSGGKFISLHEILIPYFWKIILQYLKIIFKGLKMVEIVNLENKKITTQKIADNDIVDVTHSINASIKEKTKDKFIKLFVDNFAYLVENCSSNARTIF